MKIPEYIRKKIRQNNMLCIKAEKLKNEILEWYEKQVDDNTFDSISDEDFTEVCCNDFFVSITAIENNLNLE